MVVGGRRKSIAFFIALGAGLVLVVLLLYIGWVLLNWRTGILLVLGTLLLLVTIAGVVLNTLFLVREIRRNEQHDAFINAVTHELKTPVASIRLYLETLQSREVDDEKRHHFYRTMLEDSERLLATIEQVLRAGRMGHAAHRPNLAPINLEALVQGCLTRSRALHNLPPDAISCTSAPGTSILGDPHEIQAAVGNLIDNAVKYSGRDVRVSIEKDQRYCTVRVSDHGPGIPRPELKRIFKRFYRVPGPLATRVRGAGLGLYIVRSVAKRHRGRAWAESDGPGQGSTFILQLPLSS